MNFFFLDGQLDSYEETNGETLLCRLCASDVSSKDFKNIFLDSNKALREMIEYLLPEMVRKTFFNIFCLFCIFSKEFHLSKPMVDRKILGKNYICLLLLISRKLWNLIFFCCLYCLIFLFLLSGLLP